MYRITLSILAMAGLPASITAQSAASHQSPGSSDTTLDQIRIAYSEERDLDAVVLTDRALFAIAEEQQSLRAEIYFWRGAAMQRLKRHDEALAAFDASRGLGFSKVELRLERALTLRTLGKSQEAEQEFQDAERELQEDPQKLDELRKRWRDSDDHDRRFHFRVYPEFGYDSNLVSLNQDAVLAVDISHGSLYYGLPISARYLAFHEREMALTLEYRNNIRGYASESELSYTDNLLSAIWQSPVGKLDWLAYEIRGSWGETWIQDDGHFRTLRIVAPALIFHPSEKWELRLWGDYTDADYYDDVVAEQDRDGITYRGGLQARIDLGEGWKVAPYLTYWQYAADGPDFDHDAWDFGVGITFPDFAGIQFVLTPGLAIADYGNPNSLSNFADERSDRRFYARLTVVLRILEKPLGFAPKVSVSYENWDSNISEYDFDRLDFSASADILAWSF